MMRTLTLVAFWVLGSASGLATTPDATARSDSFSPRTTPLPGSETLREATLGLTTVFWPYAYGGEGGGGLVPVGEVFRDMAGEGTRMASASAAADTAMPSARVGVAADGGSARLEVVVAVLGGVVLCGAMCVALARAGACGWGKRGGGDLGTMVEKGGVEDEVLDIRRRDADAGEFTPRHGCSVGV